MSYQQGPYGGGGYGPSYGQAPVVLVGAKSPSTAVMLELLPGFFFQTFGIGNMYAGNVGAGVALMLGYWFVTGINIALCFVLVGFLTWPLTWIVAMVISSILASNAAKAANERMMRTGQIS